MRTGITDVQQTFRVKALYKHNDFTMQNLKHDIAVLQLEGSAQLSDKVTTVCLPDKDADLNSKCYITGRTFIPSLILILTCFVYMRNNAKLKIYICISLTALFIASLLLHFPARTF